APARAHDPGQDGANPLPAPARRQRDVLLDHAGVPNGVDQAWQMKHYLGAPVPGTTMATVNLARVVTAVEFVIAEMAEPPDEQTPLRRDEIDTDRASSDPLAETRERSTSPSAV